MGRITEALKKMKDERFTRIQKKPQVQHVVKKVADTDIDEHIIVFHDTASPIAEQYKILRTNIQALKLEKGHKAFVITSSINKEGKTVTSLNLALTMAQDLNDKSILLIDADTRKGAVARYLGIKRKPGLSDVLQGKVTEDSVLINPNGIGNFVIMPSGRAPKNPSELLNSKRMAQIIATFKNRFDYVFIDSPPVMPLADACILGSMVDGVILIVQAGKTQREMVKTVQQRLGQARAKTLGCVVTNVEYHVPHYLYRYIQEYGHYESYINESEKEKVKVR